MFAVFLTDKMDPFYLNISSFPTVIFTFFLFLSAFYWLVAVLGLVDLDFIDIDLPDEAGNSGTVAHEGLAGVLLKFGFNGVPLTIIITLWSLTGWLICYYLVDFIFPLVPDGILGFVTGVGIFMLALYTSAYLTGKLVRPLRPFFAKLDQPSNKDVLGQVAIVRTLRLEDSFGEVTLEDGGAGLIFKARADSGVSFKKGDRVVLLEFKEEEHFFRVISEEEFIN